MCDITREYVQFLLIQTTSTLQSAIINELVTEQKISTILMFIADQQFHTNVTRDFTSGAQDGHFIEGLRLLISDFFW